MPISPNKISNLKKIIKWNFARDCDHGLTCLNLLKLAGVKDDDFSFFHIVE